MMHPPVRADWLATLVLAPGLVGPRLAAMANGLSAGDGLLLGLVVILALAIWLGRRGLRRRHRQDIEVRLRQMSSLIEHADGVLWEAEVELTRDDWTWRMKLHPSAFCRRLFADRLPQPRVDLWADFVIDQRAEMDRRARAAIEAGQAGYEQEFRAVRGEQVYWLHESVSITKVETSRYWLVGLVTDVTARREAEVARQQSEQTIARILAQARCMLWRATVVEERGELVWRLYEVPRSQLTEELFGADWTARPERGFWDRMQVPELPAMNARSTQAIRQGAAGYSQAFTATTEAGRTFWLQEQVAITAAGPGAWDLVGVIMDTTAQRQLEAARQASELRLRELLQRADCLLWEAEVGLTPDDWKWKFEIQDSAFYRRLHGRPRPDQDLSLWRDFNIPESEEMLRRCRSAMESNRPGYEQLFHIVREDGTAIWIQEKVTIRALGPDRYSLVGVATDITRQHEAEVALANEKERLAVTLRAMTEAVITTDVAGAVQYLNPAATTLTQWRADEAIGRRVDEVCQFVPSRGGDAVRLPWDQVARGEIVADLPAHTELVGRGDRRRLVEGCCVPIHAAGSAVTGMVLVFRDVTEQERLEQELVRAARLESVGILAGGIAHDFNNLLTTILGGVSMAKDARDYSGLENSERACLAAKGLSKQLLTFSKGGTAVRQVVKPADILQEAVRLAAAGSTVKIELNADPAVPTICVDRAQMLQVFQNLIINSIQAMATGQGNIWITAAAVKLAEGEMAPLAAGPCVAVEVRDNGSGIKPEHLEKIFAPFFTTKKTGTGLGLATVLSIVKRHGGQMGVESEVGVGTAFTVYLPQADKPEAVEARPAPSLRFGTGRVLFMDDDENICTLTGGMLESLGYKYDLAKHGEEAVQLYKRYLNIGRPYDVVIMDLTIIGGLGGEQTFKLLKEMDPEVRAIIASGYDNDEMARQFLDLGFCGYLSKPYRVGDLGKMIRTVLGK